MLQVRAAGCSASTVVLVRLPKSTWMTPFHAQIFPIKLRKSLQQNCANLSDVDISNVDKIKRNPLWAESIMKSYARNICQLTEYRNIYKDVKNDTNMAESTFYEYLESLQQLYIIDDVEAWCPSIRSKTAIRSSKKKIL